MLICWYCSAVSTSTHWSVVCKRAYYLLTVAVSCLPSMVGFTSSCLAVRVKVKFCVVTCQFCFLSLSIKYTGVLSGTVPGTRVPVVGEKVECYVGKRAGRQTYLILSVS